MPWGSYGEMLWQGIYCYDKDTNSHMIFRTGAFCPSIYRSQYNRESPVLIVKEDVLQYIIESNLTGFVLQPVNKEKIVKLDWENWDLQSPEPLIYPSGSMDAEEYITREIPQVSAVKGQATYLLWIDCTGIAKKDAKFSSFIRESSGLYLSDGAEYRNGEGFLRMNLACSREVLKDGLQRFRQSVQAYLE